jgi:alpha-tubulin suppressor-like RCC1 family protein
MALFRIKRQNINDSALNVDKFDETVQNQISVDVQSLYDSVNLAAPAITSVAYANSSYTILDDTAANVSGGYIVISGSGFQSGAQITIGSDSATSVTHVNSSTIRAQIPAKDAGSYHLTLINPTGGISILVNGITYSNTPVWGTAGTLDNQAVDTAFAVTLSANSDSNVTYSNTTTLPTGTALLSNGYFYGTISGIESETTYNFTVAAIDEELQDNPREFSVTVTVGPPPGSLWSSGSGAFKTGGLAASVLSFTQVGTDTDWSDVSSGSYIGGGVKSDGTLWLWGNNTYGALGINSSSASDFLPTQVGTDTNWSSLYAGNRFCFAVKSDGSLWAWGQNNQGQLGLNDRVYKSSPTQVGNTVDWIGATFSASGRDHTMALKDNGTLWTWGRNDSGQLGLGDKVYRSSPTQMGNDNYWSSINCGYGMAGAIKNDGTLWLWGENDGGQLGQNNKTLKSSPVQVGTDTNWTSFGCRNFCSATKTDGTLWTWGNNTNGCLGQNNAFSRSLPQQVGADTDWSTVYVGIQNFTFVIKTDSTLWGYGFNGYGNLGVGNTDSKYSSPVQISMDTNWTKISPGLFTSSAIKDTN